MATICDLSPALRFLVSDCIPPEVVLQVIEHIPFERGERITSLGASTRFASLLKRYEHSITQCFMKKELRHALVDFPYSGKFGLDWLSHCVSRYDTVDAIMDELTWRENCVAVESHNVALVNAGLLLLYRLTSLQHHDAKLELLQSLPRDSLIAIYLALHHATLTARFHGRGWIHQGTYGRFMDANQLSLRNELEFCFAEATLSIGPDFLFDMLVTPTDPRGEITLLNFYHDHGTHDWEWPCWGDRVGEFEPPRTQGPHREVGGTARSLFTTMLEMLAMVEKCTLVEVRSMIEESTAAKDHELAFLNLEGKARVIQGLNVE